MLLKKSPNGVTRQRFTGECRAESGSESAASETQQAFNAFAPHGGDKVERAIVDERIAPLNAAAEAVRN